LAGFFVPRLCGWRKRALHETSQRGDEQLVF
jgi:hypothetical protein